MEGLFAPPSRAGIMDNLPEQPLALIEPRHIGVVGFEWVLLKGCRDEARV